MENDKPIIINMRLLAVSPGEGVSYATVADERSMISIVYKDAPRFRNLLPQNIIVTIQEK